MRQGFPVTVAELLVSGGRPQPAEAAAIVLGVCARIAGGPKHVVAAPISASSVFVETDGSVSVAGGTVTEDEQTVCLLGHLLLEMLRAGGGSYRPAARLEALALRAAAASEAAGLTVARFASEVRRFAPEDAEGAVRGLFDRWRGGGRPAPRDGQVPETIRRLLPEADLAAMAGLPTLHGPGVRAGLLHAGRRLVLAAVAVLLLGLAAAAYVIVNAGPDAEARDQRPQRPNASVRPAPATELLPGGTPAARPIPAPQEKVQPAPKGTSGSRPPRVPAGPN